MATRIALLSFFEKFKIMKSGDQWSYIFLVELNYV